MGIVINRLQADKEMYLLEQEDLPVVISIASSLRDQFKGPAINTTSLTLSSINSANNFKNQIIAIGGNTGLTAVRYGNNTANITSKYGSIVSGVGSTTADYLGISGLGTDDFIAYGIINADEAKIYDYSSISGGNYGVEFPFLPEGFVTLTSSNLGVGVSTRVYQSSGSELGKVLDIIGPQVDVSSLISQYNTISATATAQATASTSTQSIKGDYELQVWGLSRLLQEGSEKISQIEQSIGISSNPAYGGPW